MASSSFFKNNGIATFPSQATAAQTRLYLGSYATNPSVDLAGDPLKVGMLYTRSTNDKLFHYNGSAWIEASPSAVGGLTDVVDDLSPQLGGDLQSNSFDIVMADDDTVTLGTDADTLLSHRASQNITWVQSDAVEFRNKSGTDLNLSLTPSATKTVRLFWQGAEKLAILTGGVTVTGDMASDSATIAGLSYPTADGNNGDTLTTDGAGNLSLQPNSSASVGSAIAFAIAL